jgi:hypothetical protein
MTALRPPSDRLLAFIDILGWSDAVKDEEREAVPAAMLEVEAQRREWEMANQIFRLDEPLVEMSHFSDCVAFSCAAGSAPAREQLLTRVCRLYVYWLQRGHLCRGAVVVGRAVHADNVVYGSALVDAYKLERELAIYPRIVVREADLAVLDLGPAGGDRQILRMDDGVPFLNPLLNWISPTQPPIDRHKAQVEEEYRKWSATLAELRSDGNPTAQKAKVIAKHEWFLGYLRKVGEMIGARVFG